LELGGSRKAENKGFRKCSEVVKVGRRPSYSVSN